MKTERNSRRQAKEKATRLSPWDKAIIIALPLITFFLIAWLIAYSAKRRQKAGIDRVIKYWCNSYKLTDEQGEHLRAIELRFHGNGNPFLPVKRRSAEEVERHQIEMSNTMDEATARRFLSDMKRSPHKR